MRRWAFIVLLVAGCATPEQRRAYESMPQTERDALRRCESYIRRGACSGTTSSVEGVLVGEQTSCWIRVSQEYLDARPGKDRRKVLTRNGCPRDVVD